MPKPDLKARVIALDTPEKTYSKSTFDHPLRKDVIQTEIPVATTRTIEEHTDPRYPPKRQVERVTGTIYHGTGSVDERVVLGTDPTFIEKKNKVQKKVKVQKKGRAKITKHRRDKKDMDHSKSECRPKDFAIKDTRSLRAEGVAAAKEAYVNSGHMLDALTSQNGGSVVLDVKTLNKREFPTVMQYGENHNLKERMESLRRTPMGVKAAHTLRRMGRF